MTPLLMCYHMSPLSYVPSNHVPSIICLLGERDEAGNTLCPADLKELARMGLVRCNLRLANTREGLKQANELNDVQLFADCAEILELQKQFSEAAAMYIKGEKFEQAADIYTKHLIKLDKNKIAEAAAIMDRVQNDQVCQHTSPSYVASPYVSFSYFSSHMSSRHIHLLICLLFRLPIIFLLIFPLNNSPSFLCFSSSFSSFPVSPHSDQHQLRQGVYDLRAVPRGRQSLPTCQRHR